MFQKKFVLHLFYANGIVIFKTKNETSQKIFFPY